LGVIGSQGTVLIFEIVSRPTVKAKPLCHLLITLVLVLYCHGVDQMAAPLVLMHAYPSAYAHRLDYVCLRCHLLMHICFCLWFLMFAYDIYARLCMFIYLLIGYHVSEGKVCWNYAVWRKGKWLVGILVLKLDKGICVYKGTCPPAVLSFFLSSSCNVLYYFPIQTSPIHTYLQPTELRSLRSSRP
jgi:hypothetical protein